MRIISALAAICFALPVGAGHHILAECREVVAIYPGTTLARLADTYFGDVEYRYSILLATNARVGQGFGFIGNPNDLPEGGKLCIPVFAEAEVEKNRFVTYVQAVREMALPYPSEVSQKLDPIDPQKPATVVSWVRRDQVQGWLERIGQTVAVGNQTWVTQAPHLQDFCRDYVAQRGPDPKSLTLRLEQRLGLAPNSAKTHFIEFEVETPGNPGQIFRPCVDSDVTTTTCEFKRLPNCDTLQVKDVYGLIVEATDGDKAACRRHNTFFLTQYYTSYGLSLPTEFPWTSLGYTFDWAHQPIGLSNDPGFIQFGESEYVMPATARVTVKSVTPTSEYCIVE